MLYLSYINRGSYVSRVYTGLVATLILLVKNNEMCYSMRVFLWLPKQITMSITINT